MSGTQAGLEGLEGVAVGRYVLRHPIAQGGMASVYLAQLIGDEGFERWVAVKLIHPHLARDEKFVAMFLDEARLTSRLVHPNVCAITDFSKGPPPHIVMEYLHGDPLAAISRHASEPMPVWLAARVIADAARGLHAAHEARGADGRAIDLVHRDVSPQNLFVLYDGTTKVIDFGVAKARGRLSETATGEIKGKIAYMPPEQLEGGAIDRRTDVWALGVVFWETLTGRRLFRGPDEGSTVHNILERRVPAASSIREGVPASIDDLIARSIERDLARRLPTAEALADGLDEYLSTLGRPSGAAQVAAWIRERAGAGVTTKDELLERLARTPPRPVEAVPKPAELESGSERAEFTRIATAQPTEVPAVGTGASVGGRSVAAIGLTGALMAIGLLAWAASRMPGRVVEEPPSTASSDAGLEDSADQDAAAHDAAARDATRSAEPDAPSLPALSRAQPPPRLRGRGTLSLMAIPVAEAFEGSHSLGTTPLLEVPLSAGRHRLRLRARDGREVERTVTVRPDELTRESVRF